VASGRWAVASDGAELHGRSQLSTISTVKWARTSAARFLISLASLSALASSHTSSNEALTPNWVMEVDIKTDKSNYAFGDQVKFIATLTNKGKSAVYVAKSFFQRGGGIAGFGLSVQQLTGKRADVGCVAAGDRFPMKDPRTPSQILQEDYLRLPPGGIVGYEDQYRGCVVKYAGTYRITATYCACDLNTAKVMSDAEHGSQVVTGEFKSKPWTFRVRERRHANAKNRPLPTGH
jgi:hypothetical protein